MISADAAKELLSSVERSSAVLLRGAKSIIDFNPQNDVDIYIPKVPELFELFDKKLRVKSCIKTAPKQFKLTVKVTNGEIVFVDVFHDVTWRGISIVDVGTLQKTYVTQLQVDSLTHDAEVWLTLMKNGLHGSSTPPSKIAGLTAMPNIWLTPESSSRIRSVEVYMSTIAWELCKSPSIKTMDILCLRASFIIIKFYLAPLESLLGFIDWSLFKIARIFYLKNIPCGPKS